MTKKDTDFDFLTELEDHLLSYAEKFNTNDLYTVWSEKEVNLIFADRKEDEKTKARKKELIGSIHTNHDLDEEIEEIIEDYENDNFWETLTSILGKRDFFETITPKEEKQIEKDGWLPEKIRTFYDKYRKEFEKNGIKNLRLNTKK